MNNLDNYIEIAKGKVNNKFWKTFILSIMAGIFIALAGSISLVASYSIKNVSVARIISATLFPIGLILVVLGKTELFTGNNLLMIGVYDKKICFKNVLKNWVICFIGNLIGALIVTFCLYITKQYELGGNSLGLKMINIAEAKISLSFINALILGIFCNFLVCLAVWLSTTVKDIIAKIFVIFIPIFTFVILGFEHSIANMYYLSNGLLIENILKTGADLTITNSLLNNLLPVTIGNIIGGALLFSLYIFYINKKRS